MGLNQYQIILVNLDPTIGTEMKKTRPCVVVSPNELNRNLKTIVIVPLTSQLKSYPTRVSITQNGVMSNMVVDQIRTIDKSRVIKTLGKLSSQEIINIKRVMRETYVD
jgi:mRNA interferase MazF